MRILGVFDRLGELFIDRSRLLGGAERTALLHLAGLERIYGHRCSIATPFDTRRRAQYAGLRLESFRDLEELKALIRRVRPGLILGNLGLVYDVVRLAEGLDLPSFVFLDSYEYCEPSDEEKALGHLSLTKGYPTNAEAAYSLATATRVFAASRYLQRVVQERHGVRPSVLYPPIELESRAIEGALEDRQFITGVCGLPHKGAEVFLQLCKAFSDERFLLLGPIDRAYRDRFARCPNLTIVPQLPTREFLGRTRILVMPSQWQEPFGRVAVEAMLSGVPTLASLCGGLAEIVGTSSAGVADFRNPEAWTRALATLLTSPDARALNVREGTRRARRLLGHQSIRKLQSAIVTAARRTRRLRRRRRLAVVGSTSDRTAFAMINARMVHGLSDRGYEVEHDRAMADAGPGAIDWWVHHDYAAEFSRVSAPSEGKWVAVRQWDFGPYPPSWAKKIREECDQLWVASRWSKTLAMQGGVPRDRIKVIPWGIDAAVFTPEGPRYRLPVDTRMTFLYVGPPIYRKGIDILLKAYAAAFSRSDDVSLVLKSHHDDLFYGGLHVSDQIRALQADPSGPAVVLIDDYLSARHLASLYRACTVGVFPYRAEGFCLPILEAMACGLPSIVPRFGACLDYCTIASSYLVPARRIALPVSGSFQFNTLGFEETVEGVDFCEVGVDRLARELRAVYEASPATIREKSRQGVRRSHTSFRWRDSVTRMTRALAALPSSRVPLRIARQRRARKAAFEVLQTARALFRQRRRHAR